MIWMSWRQFRAQAVVGAAVLILLAIYLVILGMQVRSTYHTNMIICGPRGDCDQVLTQFLNSYRSRIYFIDAMMLVVPGLLGLFWGAPLIARELEAGTHRLVWNQSVTRRRWFTIKLLVVGFAAVVATGALSALVTWAASRYDQVAQGPLDPLGAGRFSTLLFGARNVAPISYAIFALILGATIGMVIRKSVPAMAVTLLLFTVVQVLVPNLVRPHLDPAVTTSQAMTATSIEHLSSVGGLGRGATVNGLKIPNAWVTSTSELLTSDNKPLAMDKFNLCMAGTWDASAKCLGDLNLHVQVTYQPLSRYWLFQWLEFGLYVVVSLLLVGFGVWRIQHRLT